MTEQDRLEKKKPMSRRDLLGTASVGAFVSVVGVCLGGLAKAILPTAMPDPSQQFKIGPPEDYPVGTVKAFDDENVIVLRDDDGIYAISTVCTHLGCIVMMTDSGDYECPCHGSKFQPDGKVTKGPAPTPLAWLKVSKLPSGQLSVDQSRQVPMGTKTIV